MKQKIFIISLLFSFIFANSQEILLNKKKVIENDIASDMAGTENEFQINLILDQDKISPDTIYSLLRGIPAIGIYGNPYNFRQRLALIKLPPLMMATAMPNQLKKQLISALGGSSIEQALTGKKAVNAQIIVNGQTQNNKQAETYNLVFHPFGYTYKETFYFQDKIPMGLFAPNGIIGKDIATNEFKPLNVHTHNGSASLALSPNNARFNIIRNRAISTFWSAAYSANKQYVTITYHILANNDLMENTLVEIFQQSATLGDVLENLQQKAKPMSGDDKLALENAIKTIRAMITPKETHPLDVLKMQLDELEVSLRQLSSQLSQLS